MGQLKEIETLVREAKKRILKIEAAALTERGQRRRLNEDAVYHCTRQPAAGQTVGQV